MDDEKTTGRGGDDEETSRAAAKRPATEQASPPRSRPMAVDVDMLKALFAEQAATILEQQRQITEDTVKGLRLEVKQSEDRIRSEVVGNTKQIQGLQRDQEP